jgi:choline dehydrogenase-like flavoprotein
MSEEGIMARDHNLSTSTRQVLLALARSAIPAGERLPAAGQPAVDRLDALFKGQPAAYRLAYEGLMQVFEQLARTRFRRGFSGLTAEEQLAFMEAIYERGTFPERQLLRLVLTPLKLCHFDDPKFFEQIECTYRQEQVSEPLPRYMERAFDAAASDADLEETIEAEVVVVGSGAGGAAVAAELAEQGVAVVLLEEGDYFRRNDFTGRPMEMLRMLYRSNGLTGTVGNCFIPVPLGRCVGGTTTINSGTCYRIPERVLRKWRLEYGLADLTPEALAPHYDKVEGIIGAELADPKMVGGIGEVVARGCDRLGYRQHGPLMRNAPDCDGSSLCCFGCPTDAKRSTNVSYVPLALRYGANLFYNASVEQILVERGRVVGVEARAGVGADARRLKVRAPAVVLACGSVGTPAMLLRQRLANSSGQLGRNLTIHPAVGIFGLFEDEIRGCNHIPQGYTMEDFHDEGMLFEGAFVPPDMGAASVTFFGPRYSEVMERFNNVGYFGFMIEDTSRGRVLLGPGGKPVMTYVMNDHDVARLKRGMEVLMRVFMAAGAEAVFPQMAGFTEVVDMRDIERFRRARHYARDFDLTAHHPLGTCHMGVDPRSSVVGPTHEVHDLPGLFICDGSAVPSSIGVNPMMTIMAMATRAAQYVARRVEDSASLAA